MKSHPRVPLSKPLLDEREAAAARRAILSGWVTQGPEVSAFEQEFAEFVGAPYACAVSSCTAALHLALLAVGAGPGDEVVTVSHSFIATANAVRYCGAEPVFVDVDPLTFNMNPDQVASAIGPRTRAILAVHQLGMPCDLRRLVPLARQHGLPLVEDAACAIGSEIRSGDRWERIGRPHGDIACFSFHPRKAITTGDGGMLTTANADWDRRFRLWRQHGMSVPDTVRHSARTPVVETYPVLGYNYRMTDIQAAIGREQLKRLPEIIARRRERAQRYRRLLETIPGVRPPCEAASARSNWQSYCVWLPHELPQVGVMQSMLDAGIATKRGVMCAHRQQPYLRADGGDRSLPVSESAEDHAILLPIYPTMTDAEQDAVVAAFREAVGTVVARS